MTASTRPVFVALLALLLATTGCRTYGGYGSEEGTVAQIQQANADFDSRLDRARSDLELLQQSAQENPSLEGLVSVYEQVVAMHEDKLALHQSYAEGLTEDSGYREISRKYGAVISEQRLVSIRYQEMHERIQQTLRTGETSTESAALQSSYQVVPLYYRRAENQASGLTMRDALQATD
jgi:hypothetical protein